MMIKNERGAMEKLEPGSHQKNEIGRIASVNDIEASFAIHLSSQSPFCPQG
jgi:hypothetical protein